MLGRFEGGQMREGTLWNEDGRKRYELVTGEERGQSTATHWYPDGTPMLRAEETEGEFHGQFETWYESGSRKSVGNYEHGRKVGIWRCWDETGDQELAVTYGSDGLLDGEPLSEDAEPWTRGCTATCSGTGPETTEVASLVGTCSGRTLD
jgi:antitoxin component YwqK of YwqJK toxin-antitoxin module